MLMYRPYLSDASLKEKMQATFHGLCTLSIYGQEKYAILTYFELGDFLLFP